MTLEALTMRIGSKLGTTIAIAAFACAVSSLGCGRGGGGTALDAKWPTASSIAPKELPPATTWSGVFFINTAGTRGTMHILTGAEDKIHGCWMAEDKHARATFTGTVKENVAKFDWTEKRVGFAGAPSRNAAYLVMTPDPDGRDRVKGEYGPDLSTDSGSEWEGVRQRNVEPKPDGCKLEEGDTLPSETKPLD